MVLKLMPKHKPASSDPCGCARESFALASLLKLSAMTLPGSGENKVNHGLNCSCFKGNGILIFQKSASHMLLFCYWEAI